MQLFKEIDKDALQVASKQEVFEHLMGNEKALIAFGKMREIFVEMDKHEDFIVKTREFLKKLRIDPCILPYLQSDSPITAIPLINKNFFLKEVLEYLERDAFPEEIPPKIAKEWISWSEFMGFFTDIERLQGTQSLPSEDSLLITRENLFILKDLFDSQACVLEVEVFVKTADFAMEAKVKAILEETASENEKLGSFLKEYWKNQGILLNREVL